MNDKKWWALPRGPERERAKAAYEAAHPEQPEKPKSRCPGGGRQDKRQRAWISRAGVVHPYHDTASAIWARQLSQTTCEPLDYVTAQYIDGQYWLVTSEGHRYPFAPSDHVRFVLVMYDHLKENYGPPSQIHPDQ
jgi:hypothetical protein